MKFKRINLSLDKLVTWFRKDYRPPSIRIMKIYQSGFDGNLIFIDVLITIKPKTNSKILLTISPDAALHLLNALMKETNKVKK